MLGIVIISFFVISTAGLAGDAGLRMPNLSRCAVDLRMLASVNRQLSEFPVETVITAGQGAAAEPLREDAIATFNAALMQRIPDLRWYNFKELNGGLGNVIPSDQLVGRTAAALLQETDGVHCYQGPIVAAEFVSSDEKGSIYQLTIRTREGDKPIIFVDRDTQQYGNWHRLYLLGKEITPEEAFQGALDAADFRQIVNETVGEPATSADYDVAIAATRLFLSLPPGHGVSSVVKTLRGKSEANKNLPEFGLVSGSKRYTDKKLESFTRKLSQFLANQSLMIEEMSDDPQAPEWLRLRKISDRGQAAIDHLKRLREDAEQSVEVANAGKPKPKTAGDFNKAAKLIVTTDRLAQRTKELRKNLGLLYERTRIVLGTPGKEPLIRVSTKKDVKAGTTTIRYQLEGARVEADMGEIKNRPQERVYFVPVVEITFETATAKPVGEPSYYWSKQEYLHPRYPSGPTPVLYSAPELAPNFDGVAKAPELGVQPSEEVLAERRTRVDAELLANSDIAALISQKKAELKGQVAEGGWKNGEYNLKLERSEESSPSSTDIYSVDGHYLLTRGKKHSLRVSVQRDEAGHIIGKPQYRWVEE